MYGDSRSTGAGGCESASSYTHGKSPTKGDGGYTISLENNWDPASSGGAPLNMSVSGGGGFKGILLYSSHGFFDGLPETLHFKNTCDEARGSKRTVTHNSPALKASVSVDLWLDPEDLISSVTLNAVVLRGVREWFWLQDIPLSSLVEAPLGPAPPPSLAHSSL